MTQNVARNSPRSLGGRYPFRLTRYVPEQIRAELRLQDGQVLLRIDDLLNIDRWEEFILPVETVIRLLQGAGYSIAAPIALPITRKTGEPSMP